MAEKYVPRLKTIYKEEIIPRLMKEFSYKNVMQVPKVEKVVLNVGLAEGMHDVKLLESVLDELATITGQRGIITRARKSIANFKLRKGMPIGCKVTLRGDRAYEFLDRFISFAIPRIRDFRGVPLKGFDGRGNYTLGITEQLIFPEINYDKIVKIHGLSVTIVTTAETDKEAKALLEAFGMPFRKTN
ncbi:ribosomal protein L5 [Hippea maritima DSM 10411]|uniref:Large ribosomal subunit protein uL5 n=1 Tax=Hippea maritima (strain ATCC 700847 / DSM 10411 / MH2) TaxID=760142 RepID=F2LXT0_HIPMA|nr:50S ribosomal protein L5 [Hippea maritima]AEA34321.1 ribosomal protein L5 [Hippea maritima DSM 10411]